MSQQVQTRVDAIIGDFTSPGASAPQLMCDRHPAEATAFRVVDDQLQERVITFGDLADRSRRVAGLLQEHGVGAGDRVATLMGKDADLPAIILGIWRLGAVYVPLFTAFASAAVTDRLEQAEVRVVITDEEQAEKIPAEGYIIFQLGAPVNPGTSQVVDLREALDRTEPWTGSAPTGPEVALTHMFTSGTTGKPKTVVHPLKYAAGWQSYLEFALGVGEDSVYWNVADPGWAYGLYAGIIAPMCAGIASILVTAKFDAQVTWRLLDQLEVTDLAAAPTVYRALRGRPDRPVLPRLRRLSSAGEPLTPDVFAWANEQWGLVIHDHFGQTELGMPAGFAHHPDLESGPRPSAMGYSLPGWLLTALSIDSDEPAMAGEVGRLAVRVRDSDFFTFTGYGVDRDNAGTRFTVDEQYYLTGDLVIMEESGLIHFSSRDDDVILMAGYRIGPFDVESVLGTHPAVQECAVVGAPDAMRGEVIHAFVVPTAGTKADDTLVAELQNWVKKNYAAHAYPRRIDFLDALPKTPSGKMQRAVLRRSLATGGDGQ
ncbi:AMP-binding protein [Arthrobacter sp. ES3-54]|uniref:AMP-binding protein n=1 Tax=Arthrobacter sp. ES3-54 TaxID=1502991 RepID=UPI002406DE04|nr:AMP-binding protein [Arthrobacter sp. ES3-54]MDF9749594.1 acetyl-CoA synthetase [Arthrobacter sp. ES3-54]